MDPARTWLQRALGCRIGDPQLLARALTHRSHGADHNERLEYLGDAVLSFLAAEQLFRAFPDADEGALSRYRASLVNGEALGRRALELGLGEHLRLGEGELKSGGYRRLSILADALEALIGAIYLDGGLDAARGAAGRLFGEDLSALPAAAPKDPKTRLQEALQAQGLAVPSYSVIEVSGEPHAQHFRVRCAIPELRLESEATGTSRRRAEQEAALQLLDRLPAGTGR